MALFRKKKKRDEEEDDELDPRDKKGRGREDDEDEEIPQSLRRKRIEAKEFKDLKPENKKKRKEPPKVWGRKERLFVLIALILTAGGSGFLALSSREWKQKDKDKADKVIAAFNKKTKDLTAVYVLYVTRLGNGCSDGIDEKGRYA